MGQRGIVSLKTNLQFLRVYSIIFLCGTSKFKFYMKIAITQNPWGR